MNINGKWYTETELAAYVAELEKKVQELEEKHWSECRQISEYDNDLKMLAKGIEEEKTKLQTRQDANMPYQLGYADALKNIKKRLNYILHESEVKEALNTFLDELRKVDKVEGEIE